MERVWSNEDFRKRYAISREQQAERMAEELLDIADDGSNDTQVDEKGRRIVDFDHINRSRLRVDTRKWIASKLLPKKYGDKTTEINVNTTIVTLNAERQTELQERRKKAEAQILIQDKDHPPEPT